MEPYKFLIAVLPGQDRTLPATDGLYSPASSVCCDITVGGSPELTSFVLTSVVGVLPLSVIRIRNVTSGVIYALYHEIPAELRSR